MGAEAVYRAKAERVWEGREQASYWPGRKRGVVTDLRSYLPILSRFWFSLSAVELGGSFFSREFVLESERKHHS